MRHDEETKRYPWTFKHRWNKYWYFCIDICPSIFRFSLSLSQIWKKQDPKPNQLFNFSKKKTEQPLKIHRMHEIVNEIFSTVWTSIHWAIIMYLFLHSFAFNKIENEIMKFGYFNMTVFGVVIVFFWIISQSQMCQIMKCYNSQLK